jgi:hypothetical protein
MMCSKYVVTLGITTASGTAKTPLDITVPFFHYGLGTGWGYHPQPFPVPTSPPYFTVTATENLGVNGPVQAPRSVLGLGLIATSDQIVNNREGSWLQVNNYVNAATAAAYQVDLLTLNIGQICAFIKNTPWQIVDPLTQTANTSTAMLSTGFNGIIYASRTPRTFVPLVLAGENYVYPASTQGSFDQPYLTAGATYPQPTGYSTKFAQQSEGGYDFPPGSYALPIYDPTEPLGYNPIAGGWSDSSMFKCPGDLPLTMYLGNSTSVMYPVTGTTTTSNGGQVGAGAAPYAYVGQPNVWAVYPTPLAVRLYNASAVNWGGVQVAAANRPQGLTVITPNTAYLQGDYNTQTFPDSSGNQQITPCAIFCDGLTTLSNAWVDDNPNNPPNQHVYTSGVTNAASTQYIISVVINNQPTDLENTQEEGSDGTHNVIRYCENWGGCTWTFQGSLVVLNRMRYTRSYVPGAPSGISPFHLPTAAALSYAASSAGSFYGVPSRVYKFNSDLLTSAGQPPASPSGVLTQRVISTVNLVNK